MATSLPVFQPRARGRIEPANIADLRAASAARHGHILRALPGLMADPLPSAFDLKTENPPVIPVLEETDDDQASCGSCWDFSGVEVVESALYRAGVIQIGQRLSKQYVLDCGKNGGCNGDDNTTVLQMAQDVGIPLTSDYGPYVGHRQRCNTTPSMKLYKIDSWLFLDSNGGQGVTSTDDIKRGLIAYRSRAGCAVAAGGPAWDAGFGNPNLTLTGRSNAIDHDVGIDGWDDEHDNGDGTKGAWKVPNSWGPKWGDLGRAWIKFGAYSIGTEAVIAIVKGPTPPPYPAVLSWLDL